ncbi:MAG: hypothetical protein CMB82_01990 [Flammeovirgaceae bacterium]|nr:hypothetical protein [Flammeovirgaceae bacterium]
MFRIFSFIFLFMSLPFLSASQLRINEFMASNLSGIEDPELGQTSDWIELYNSGTTPLNLSGYYLTDNLNQPDKWLLPVGTMIEAEGYLLFWADGEAVADHTNFKLSAGGESIGIYTPELIVIDSITYPKQRSDISYGRHYEEWVFFESPTPGAQNETIFYSDYVMSVPSFSKLGGLMRGPQMIELSTDFGGDIRYTLDGSWPGESSFLYESPIIFQENTIIRAAIFKSNQLPGPVQTHSYFVDPEFYKNELPIISITGDPDDFWDEEKGIYVQDFKPEWEIPINIEFFENFGEDRASFNELAGTKINGLMSWQLPQRMLGIYFKKKYGNNSLDYQLFADRSRDVFENFALRASGSDWTQAFLRDPLSARISEGNMKLANSGYRPVILTINGEYMGIHNIRSKINSSFISQKIDLSNDEFDMVEHGDYAEVGDLNAYNHLLEILSEDLSDESNFDKVEDLINIENYTDYVIMQMFLVNISFNHNVMAWKPKLNGKWEWIMADFDRGFLNQHYRIEWFIGENNLLIDRMLTNDGFKAFFFKRFADHLYTTFNPNRVDKIVADYKMAIDAEMPRHIERWKNTRSDYYGEALSSYETWVKEVEDLNKFVIERRENVWEDFENYGFNARIELGIGVYPEDAGQVTLNGMPVETNEALSRYLENVVFNLEATPQLGFDFLGWSNTPGGAIIDSNPNIEVIAEESINYYAVFETNDICLVPSLIEDIQVLNKECSPYYMNRDVWVKEDAVLVIEPGVEILIAEGTNLIVNGAIIAEGNLEQEIIFRGLEYQEAWGAINLLNTSDTSIFNFVTIKDASVGVIPTRDKGALSLFKANVKLNYLNITEVHNNPIFAQYSWVSMHNSILQSEITGDLINVKYGNAFIQNTTFVGNRKPDTDGIDFDEIYDGVIKNCEFYDFMGFNSDGIDIGEGCENIEIDSVIIYNITDKGISVGQTSSVNINNALIFNTGIGVAVKDSSWASVKNSTFYNNRQGVASYEKNPGMGGGNIVVNKSIISNAANTPFWVDEFSTLVINNSISDTDVIPGTDNTLTNPQFKAPGDNDFNLMPNSPALLYNPTNDRIGAPDYLVDAPKNILMVQIYNDTTGTGTPEFIALFNPNLFPVDLNGYQFTDGITHKIEGAPLIQSQDTMWISALESALYWPSTTNVQAWSSGKLADEGEKIILENSYGIVIDHVDLRSDNGWPTFENDQILSLKDASMDNHIGSYWHYIENKKEVIAGVSTIGVSKIYPNPARDWVDIQLASSESVEIVIFSLDGSIIDSKFIQRADNPEIRIPLVGYPEGLIIFQIGNKYYRVIHR